jgi:YVTN family beta-propeller protein
VSGGTRAPTRVSGGQAAPSARLGRFGPWVPWALAGVLTLTCIALGIALLLDDDQPSGSPGGTQARAPAAEPSGTIAGFPIQVGDAPSAITVGSKYVWALNELSGTLVAIDPTRNEIVGPQVQIGGRPRFLALANGSLWISSFDGNTITRVSSPTRAVVGHTKVGRSPWGIGVASGAIWVVNHDDDTVQPVSTSTGEPSGSPIEVGQAPVAATVAESALWVTNSQSDSVTRVDLRGRTVADTIPVGDNPEGISFGAGAVWVSNLDDDTVSRINPATNKVVAKIPVGDRPLFLKASESGVWVPNSGDGTLSRIDPATNEVVGAPVKIGRSVDRVGVGFDGIWAVDSAEDTLTRVSPR